MTKPICIYNGVFEHDVDMMMLQLFSTDREFVQLFIHSAGLSYDSFEVLSVELSRTDSQLGESDVTVLLSVDGKKIAILIEDKINAINMPEQPERYIKRGNKAITAGEYTEFLSFIVCPRKYYDSNEAARMYPYYVTYETILEYLNENDSPLNSVYSQQITQAIEKAKKPPQTILNENANRFFQKYKREQQEQYPELDLRTRSSSNGYWAHYATRLGSVYIHHKIQEGKVDITFSNASTHMNEMEQIAAWLRNKGYPGIKAAVAGRAGVLNIEVPKLDMQIDYEKNNHSDIIKCFDAIREATMLSNMIALTSDMAKLK